jgi:hypothetical protein
MAVAGWIEDRWLTKRKNPKTGKRERTALYATNTKRYRVCGIPGVRKRSFHLAEDAKAWLKRAGADSERGTYYDPRDGAITLREYVEETWWPTLRVPPTTKQSMESRVFLHILPHVGHLSLNKIGSDEIKWWAIQAEQEIDVSTVRVTWRHFSKIMQAAKAAKKIPENPFRDPELKAPTAPKSKAKAWAQEVALAVRTALAPRYRILVDLAGGAGLRQGEAFAFSPADMDGEVIRRATRSGTPRSRRSWPRPSRRIWRSSRRRTSRCPGWTRTGRTCRGRNGHCGRCSCLSPLRGEAASPVALSTAAPSTTSSGSPRSCGPG